MVADERVGTTVGGCWTLDALLGVGGTAAVYAATHTSGRRAAFKVLRGELSHDHDVRARFLRELAFASRIEHPARVRVEGASRTDDGALLLLMELLEGETLEARWRREGPLPALEAFTIAERLLDFLHVCHGQGIVHRDLKPSNLFLTHGGALKVMDFGIARDTARVRTAANVALGTPSYMAPEQTRTRNDCVDGRADLFAVGAILYTVITGRPMRRGASEALLRAQASREVAAPLSFVAPGIPAVATSVVDRALQWEPSARYRSAAAMRLAVLVACESLEEISALKLDPPFEAPIGGDDRATEPDTPRALVVGVAPAVLRDARAPEARADARAPDEA